MFHSLPVYPDHLPNYDFIKQFSTESQLSWSLFCASQMDPAFPEPQYPAPKANDSSKTLISGKNAPPGWSQRFKGIPLIGNVCLTHLLYSSFSPLFPVSLSELRINLNPESVRHDV
jgi:hypothetical protein